MNAELNHSYMAEILLLVHTINVKRTQEKERGWKGKKRKEEDGGVE